MSESRTNLASTPGIGHHWMIDAFDCRCNLTLLETVGCLEDPCIRACTASGMQVLSSTFHQFSPVGITGVVLLSESHFAIHTWPEHRFVSFDVYVCNFNEENCTKGERVVNRLIKLLAPEFYQRIPTERGRAQHNTTHRYLESLTADFGYWIQASPLIAPVNTSFQKLEVLTSPSFGNILRLDGAFQYSDRDECCYHEPLVHMAMAHHPSPHRVTIIGGGDGGAARQALKWPEVNDLAHVELDAEVVRTSRAFFGRTKDSDGSQGTSSSIHNDARYRLYIENGFHFVERMAQEISRGHAAHCDVLILDLTDEGGPSAPLYTKTFLEKCRTLIGQDGLLTLHLASPWFQTERCETLVHLLRSVFPQVVPFMTNVPMSGGQWLMAMCAGGAADLSQGPEHLQHRLQGVQGASLHVVNGRTLEAMKALPCYLELALSATPPGY
jgi:spermidine synthase